MLLRRPPHRTLGLAVLVAVGVLVLCAPGAGAADLPDVIDDPVVIADPAPIAADDAGAEAAQDDGGAIAVIAGAADAGDDAGDVDGRVEPSVAVDAVPMAAGTGGAQGELPFTGTDAGRTAQQVLLATVLVLGGIVLRFVPTSRRS